VLGCLVWPELPKLEGHSDGDSIAHAIVDSLLSAAGLGDIGSNFGVDRPEFAGASGEVFISETLKLIAARGFSVENVSVQVIADKPKIGPRRNELEARLSGVVGARVSVGATTTDGLGFLADSRGVAAVATALLKVLG
jgi:2-C-methyl-D-erythritol 4-phosphate cytidylyltransferase/2-C-methyl-D-erythritol 2,4-cyclodiphosphate synthase